MPLGSDLKKHTDIAKTQYQRLGKVSDDKNPKPKKYNKSDLIHDSEHGFYKYREIKKFGGHSFEVKYSFLANFVIYLDKFSRVKAQKEKTKTKTICLIELQNYIMAYYIFINTMIY